MLMNWLTWKSRTVRKGGHIVMVSLAAVLVLQVFSLWLTWLAIFCLALLRPPVFWPPVWQNLCLLFHDLDLDSCSRICITVTLPYELKHTKNSHSLFLGENATVNSKWIKISKLFSCHLITWPHFFSLLWEVKYMNYSNSQSLLDFVRILKFYFMFL